MTELHEYPVYRSLVFPTLLFGMPRMFFILLVTVTVTIVVFLGQIWFLPLSLLIAIIIYFITKEDPYFFDIYVSVLKLPEVFD